MMKKGILFVLAGALLLASIPTALAADTNSLHAELGGVIAGIRTKLSQGKTNEADFAPDLKALDKLVAEHSKETQDTLANVLAVKAELYLQAFRDPEKAAAVIKQIQRKFPKSRVGRSADKTLAALQASIRKQHIRAKLVKGARFPNFDVQDVNGKRLSLDSHKGKVVLLDFWATWCPPCVAEVPSVVKTYKQYHPKGFDIIGISLDDSRARLQSFLKEHNMTWPQYFDGQHWNNKLAVKYGVESTPTTYLLDRKGRIIAKNLRGDDLEQAVAKAVQN